MPPTPTSLRHTTIRSISLLSSLLASSTSTNPNHNPNPNINPNPKSHTNPKTMPSSPSPTSPPPYPTRSYTPQNPNRPFPYTQTDLTPMDASPDSAFYSTARFVTHIDDNAIAQLQKYYDFFLPRTGHILDFCSSWVSHYPARIGAGVSNDTITVLGTGMNAPELQRNPLLTHNGQQRWRVQDLNADPDVIWPGHEDEHNVTTNTSAPTATAPQPNQVLEASTCTVSIDYLTAPVPILSSILTHTKPNGTIHLIISNRCFPTKAVRRWLQVSEEARLEMVGDYLWWSGWREIEIVEVVGKEERGGAGIGGMGGGWFGSRGGGDPLWVVRGGGRLQILLSQVQTCDKILHLVFNKG